MNYIHLSPCYYEQAIQKLKSYTAIPEEKHHSWIIEFWQNLDKEVLIKVPEDILFPEFYFLTMDSLQLQADQKEATVKGFFQSNADYLITEAFANKRICLYWDQPTPAEELDSLWVVTQNQEYYEVGMLNFIPLPMDEGQSFQEPSINMDDFALLHSMTIYFDEEDYEAQFEADYKVYKDFMDGIYKEEN